MTYDEIPASWSSRFGLASLPLFGSRESAPAGSHHVLLDGGFGSFALSVSPEQIWKERLCADWSWSCNLPHHVTITDNEVAVVRWDKANAELFTRHSVEGKISTFYSYLASDRVESNKRVVDFMLNLYRSIRSLTANARMDDDRSIDAFLAFLSCATRRAHGVEPQSLDPLADNSEDDDLLKSLPQDGVDSLFEEVFDRNSSDLSLSLVPSLAIRHAGSEIFQEAHFELLRAPGPDLFGYVGPAETRPITRGGAHFTPPALARTIVEQTLAQIPDLRSRKKLVVLDPACGSGAFLHETLRALRRQNYDGQVVLVGRDTSGAAVSMARFVLANAVSDWCPSEGCDIQIEQGDSLSSRLPGADIVLMNPPFLSWVAVTAEQRSQMKEVLGSDAGGRGDYSMAFVSRAMEAVYPGGALGTLLPGSLLTLGAAARWRGSILEQADLRFIASLGDYHLFRYAQVQVSAVVFSKVAHGARRSERVVALVTGNSTEATGVALRNLRRLGNASFRERRDTGWYLFEIPSKVFRDRPTWRLISPSTETAIRRLSESGRMALIEELFSVRQGVRTGMNSAFLITTQELEELPAGERKWFRPASVNESIQNGILRSNHHIFYPYNERGLMIRDEHELDSEVPVYSQRYLRPNRSRLSQRPSLRSSRSDWWGLSERRNWALDPKPRIVSKYFGGPGSFAVDFHASYVVVQGFAWLPRWGDDSAGGVEGRPLTFGLRMREILAAYSVILNSHVVARLLSVYSQHMAGGQYDLSQRFVRFVPVPNLPTLMAEERASHVVLELAQIGQRQRSAEPLKHHRVEGLVAQLYEPDFVQRI